MDKGVYSRLSNYLLMAVLVVIIALSAVKLLFPAENYRDQIAQQLTTVSNTPIEVRGSLEWFLSPLPSLSIDEIYLPELKVSLQQVDLSFSLFDLFLLKVSPSQLKINKVVATVNNVVRAPVKKVSIYFDETGRIAESFSLLIAASASSNSKNAPIFRFDGSIEQTDTKLFSIAGHLTREEKQTNAEQRPFDDLKINAKLSIIELTKSIGFDVSLSTKAMTITANGLTSFENQAPAINFEKIKTPNIALTGKSYWSKNEAVFKNDFKSSLITIPKHCFSADKHLIAQNCYDLALLMMLPGNNQLTIDTLLSHDQSINNVSFYWQTNDGKMSISDFNAEAFDGEFHLDAGYKIANSRWDFSLNSSKINVKKLLSAFTTEPLLFGTGSAQLTGSGEFINGQAKNHKVSGDLQIVEGKTELFNLEKQLCTQVEGVVITNSISTPFNKLNLAINLQNDHLQITHFNTQLDGAQINGQGELTLNKELQLAMNVKVDKQDWNLCKIPRALTSIEWPLTCKKQLGSKGNCTINLKQMGLKALLLAESPETKDKAKQKIRELKESDKVKKALSRFEQWLNK